MVLFNFWKNRDGALKKDILSQSALPQLEIGGPNQLVGKMIEAVFTQEVNSSDFQNSYESLLIELYQLPYIFVALSLSEYKSSTKESLPMISAKDQNMPAIYLFSTFEIAKVWCEHYNNYNNDGYLLGILYKDQSAYQSIYRIAHSLGVERVMFDEGSRFINFKVTDMIQFNQISDIIRVSVHDVAVLDRLQFVKCSIIEQK